MSQLNGIDYPHVMAQLFGQPLMISGMKLDQVMEFMVPRLQGAQANVHTIEPTPERAIEKQGLIGILPVVGTLAHRGTLMSNSSGMANYMLIASQIDNLLADPRIETIVLDVDSPGGSVAGAFDLADKIYQARGKKRIVSLARDMAASAGYLIASAASEVYLTQTALVGSIGAYGIHLDRSEADAQDGLSYTIIRSTPGKGQGSPHEPLSDQARDQLQSNIDSVGRQFVSVVARHRQELTVEKISAMDAALFKATDALANGLADQIQSFDSLMAKLANNPKGQSMSDPQGASTPGQVTEPQVEPQASTIDRKSILAQAAEISGIVAQANGMGASLNAEDLIASGQSPDEVRKIAFDAVASAEPVAPVASHTTNKNLPEEDPSHAKDGYLAEQMSEMLGA